jgi:hypothetical protein
MSSLPVPFGISNQRYAASSLAVGSVAVPPMAVQVPASAPAPAPAPALTDNEDAHDEGGDAFDDDVVDARYAAPAHMPVPMAPSQMQSRERAQSIERSKAIEWTAEYKRLRKKYAISHMWLLVLRWVFSYQPVCVSVCVPVFVSVSVSVFVRQRQSGGL